MKSRSWIWIGVAVVALAGAFLLLRNEQKARPVLRVLAWVGYEEEDFLASFKSEFGADVLVKNFVGGDQMYALFSQAPNDYDIVVVDPEYVSKLQRDGRLSELRESDYDFSGYFEPFKRLPLTYPDGKLRAVLVRWGSCGLGFNTQQVTLEEASSYEVLWNPKFRGRVGIWDWYIPNMGLLSRGLGNAAPYDLSNEAFGQLATKLNSLKGQFGAVYSTPAAITQALASGESAIVPGVGEWVTARLEQQGIPVSWTVPKEGGIMWIETLVIPKGAKNPELAKKFIQWMQRPAVQAALTQRVAYQSNSPVRATYDLLTPEQRRTLRASTSDETEALIGRLSIRTLPVRQSEAEWQAIWTQFKAN